METPANNFILGLLAYAAQRDIAPEQLCKLAHIDPAWLRSANKRPLSEKQVNDLWLNVLHLSKDAQFGLHLGESLQLSALGIVGEIIKSSKTVGEAVTNAAGLVEHVTDWFNMTVTRNSNSFTIHINPLKADWKSFVPAVQMLDVFMVLVIHELDGLLLHKIAPLTVSYMPGIDNLHEYERVFRCRPVAKSRKNAITFDSSFWDEPIITANYELQHFLKEKMSAALNQVKKNERLSDKINRYLISNAYLGILSLEETAANFHMSPRTLQRRLKEEDVSFQQLADSARQYLAVQTLKQGKYSVKEIAYMMGYNELSAFSRAFKRWTGNSPESYRLKYSTQS
ncbi:AraC family transcriptional regulator [Longitalea luteola]|uniref:AraC family transcriptional regulator n=1 Tax=Longitalea luteola TaxID=2812563 RepID=UPI001A95E122|nr:AraC family transcriptional regulator [Longitalea luteola]